MAHTKATGTTKNLKDSRPKYLGVKLYGGQVTKPGSIIVRQRGTKFVPGIGTRIGSDDTIYAIKKGKVQFVSKKAVKYNGLRKLIKVINVI